MPAPEVIPQRYEPHVPLDRLTPHPANPNDGDLGLLCDLIDANGFAGAVLAQESTGLLIDGEHRWRTALEKGMTGLPVLWLDVDDDSRDRLLASLNESTRRGRNDEAKLVALLTGLAQTERGLTGTAFDGDDLDELMAGLGAEQGRGGTGHSDPDDVAEPPAEPVTKPGDLWMLAGHRLLCGDAAERRDVASLGAERADIIVTDPPYSSGGRQDGGKRNSTSIGTRGNEKIARDNLTTRGYLALLGRVLGHADAEAAYVFTDWRMWSWTFDAMESSGYPVRNMLVWDKQQMGMGFPWRSQHELIAFAKRTGAQMGDGKAGNVLQCARTANELHPTQKPVELLARLLSNTPGDSVYDPFGGSGTTLIAAIQEAKSALIMEVDEGYCDVICRRFEAFTGITPELVRDGSAPKPVSFTGDQP